MKKITLLCLVLIFGSLTTLMANEVDRETAQKVASKFYYETNMTNGMSIDQVLVSESYTIMEEGQVVYFVFNFKTTGFVIVSAEDSRNPIIGYSNENDYVTVDPSDNYASYMRTYANEIVQLRANRFVAPQDVESRWNHLLEPISKSVKSRDVVVDALCPAEWNQDSPYNYYCPQDAAGPGGRVYAGCVATAMSQIVYYWRWPFEGEGTSSYNAGSYGTITANYAETSYDPHGMINSADNVLASPLSMMMYHCAVSVEMQFAPDGSGAYSEDVPSALRNHFKYGFSTHRARSSYTTGDWINMLEDQLDAKRCVYYAGVEPPNYGHAFVCDGYDDSFNYHFNFGWSGSNNGFYDLNDVGGYYDNQRMIVNIEPDDGLGYPYYCYGNTELNYLQGTIGDGSGPVLDYQDNANATWLIDPSVNGDYVESIDVTFHKFELANGDVLRIYDGATTSADLLGEFTGNTLPEDLESTGGVLLVEFVSDASGTANGFLIEWDSYTPKFCSGMTMYTEPEGEFDDGSGDYKYANGTNCMYQIMPEWSTGTTLTFDAFDTEEADLVKIYDGANGEILLAELSGTYDASNMPGPFYAESGQFLVQFSSNAYLNASGFHGYYTSDNVSVDQIDPISNLQIVPNPASDNLSIRFKSNKEQDIKVKMYSTTGQLVFEDSYSNFAGNYNNTISVSDYTAGVYFLNIECGTTVQNQKVVIK